MTEEYAEDTQQFSWGRPDENLNPGLPTVVIGMVALAVAIPLGIVIRKLLGCYHDK